MKTMNIMGVPVECDESVPEDEAKIYVDRAARGCPDDHYLFSMTITVGDDDMVDLKTVYKPIGFERIRRITGYLVGTVDRFNDAKMAEERDRVKHGV